MASLPQECSLLIAAYIIVCLTAYLAVGVGVIALYSFKRDRLPVDEAWGTLLFWPIVAPIMLITTGVVKHLLWSPERFSRAMYQRGRSNERRN